MNNNGEFIPIGNFTELNINSDLLTIARFNRQRAASVTAEIDGDITTPRSVISSALEYYDTIADEYPGYKLALDGEEQDTRESLNSVKRASVIAILLIYLILATILRSYIQPLLIMSIVPFCLIGGVIDMIGSVFDKDNDGSMWTSTDKDGNVRNIFGQIIQTGVDVSKMGILKDGRWTGAATTTKKSKDKSSSGNLNQNLEE